jgi:hypothetical protein
MAAALCTLCTSMTARDLVIRPLPTHPLSQLHAPHFFLTDAMAAGVGAAAAKSSVSAVVRKLVAETPQPMTVKALGLQVMALVPGLTRSAFRGRVLPGMIQRGEVRGDSVGGAQARSTRVHESLITPCLPRCPTPAGAHQGDGHRVRQGTRVRRRPVQVGRHGTQGGGRQGAGGGHHCGGARSRRRQDRRCGAGGSGGSSRTPALIALSRRRQQQQQRRQ